MKELIKKILREEENVGTVVVAFPGLGNPCSLVDRYFKKSSKKVLCFEARPGAMVKAREALKELTYDRLEVIGFSAGGILAVRLSNNVNIDSLILLDPAIPKNWEVNNFPSDSTLLYNIDGWKPGGMVNQMTAIDVSDEVATTFVELPKLAKAMQNKGMYVENTQRVAHSRFPDYYFDKFYSEESSSINEQDIDLNRDPDAQDTHAQEVQDLKSADEPGGWGNPLTDDSPGNVPPNSYIGQTYNHETKRYVKPTITKSIFFKAVQILTKMHSAEWFTMNEDVGDNLWSRQQDMSTALKVLGIEKDGGITDKIFWAANDNRKGIIDGSITNYDQLYLRPLIEYKVPLYESVREYKTISWAPMVECYSKDDAFNSVIYDEDDIYSSYEWDGHSSYNEDSEDWEGEGKELDGEIQVVTTIYPAEEGGETVSPIKESINEEIGASPVENDIISELEETLSHWDACEEGMPVGCRYKNDVQEIIDRYKSKTLYEHKLIKEATQDEDVNEIAAKLMGVLVSKLGKDRIKEMEKEGPNTIYYEILPYSKMFGLGDMHDLVDYHKQLIQFMVNKGIPEDYTEFIGEQLPVLHEYSFEKTFIKREDAVYSGSIYLQDTNYDSARCDAQKNFWELEPDEEYVEQQDSEFIGDEEWYSVHIDDEIVWSDSSVENDQEYNPLDGC